MNELPSAIHRDDNVGGRHRQLLHKGYITEIFCSSRCNLVAGYRFLRLGDRNLGRQSIEVRHLYAGFRL